MFYYQFFDNVSGQTYFVRSSDAYDAAERISKITDDFQLVDRFDEDIAGI